METRPLLSTAILLAVLCSSGCGAEMVRPRPAGERFEDRPGRALVVGEYAIIPEGIPNADIGMTSHAVFVGTDRHLFREEIPDDGRAFALWVYPGVFCFGQPSYGTPPVVLGGKQQLCAEIPEAGKAYYVGTVIYKVKKQGSSAVAELEIKDKRESVAGSQFFVGIYLDASLVSQDVKPEAVAAKYKIK